MRRHLVLPLLALISAATLASARSGTGPGGYTWRDCEEPAGPSCTYEIAASSDGFTGLCTDEIYRPPGGIGFSFPFYGTTYTSFWVSGNGVVYLSSPPAGDAANASLTGLEGRPILAALWDDWAMDNDDELAFICPDPGCSNSGPLTAVESYRLGSGVDGGGVAYRDIEWFDTAKHRPACSEPETATFGLRLYQDGRILFSYLDASVGQPGATDQGVSATVGISRGTLGEMTQVAFDAISIPYVPYSILFTPPCSALACNSITAPADACEGDLVTFRANVAGGVAPVTITWDFDGDTIPEATGNPVDRALPAGIASVTATATDSCPDPGPSTCSVSRNVNVHAAPVPVVTPSGATSFCGADGESVTLLADVGYASYQWSRDGFDIPTGTTRSLNVNVSGSFVVRVTDAFGCEGVSAPILVDATSCTAGCAALTCDDVLVSPDPACEGRQVSLTAIFSGGEGAVTVAWDVDGDTVPDASGNPLRRVFATGATTVTAIVTDSCALPAPQSCSRTATVNVSPAPAPIIVATPSAAFCDGESVTLDAGAGFAGYQWTFGGSDVLGETSQTIAVTTFGDWTVRVVDAAGCTGESAVLTTTQRTDCGGPCTALACDSIVVPAALCDGAPFDATLVVSGGEGVLFVEWDVDGDGGPDASGNPATLTLPAGRHRIRAKATDECAVGQSCEVFADLDVSVGAAALGEVSGLGEPPLLVVGILGATEVEDEPDATAYHAYVDAIGSWWAPFDASGRSCALPPSPGGRPDTVRLGSRIPPGSWIVVVGANPCAEGTPGTSSRGVLRSSGPGWSACGPAP